MLPLKAAFGSFIFVFESWEISTLVFYHVVCRERKIPHAGDFIFLFSVDIAYNVLLRLDILSGRD